MAEIKTSCSEFDMAKLERERGIWKFSRLIESRRYALAISGLACWLTVVHHEVGEEAGRRAAVARQHVHGPVLLPLRRVAAAAAVPVPVPQRDVASAVP